MVIIPELRRQDPKALKNLKERIGGGLPQADLPPKRRELLKTDEQKAISSYLIEIGSKGEGSQVYDSKISLSFIDPNLAPGDSIEVHEVTLYFCPDNNELPANRGFVHVTPLPLDPNLAPGDSTVPDTLNEIECHIYFHNRKLLAIVDTLRNEKPVYFYYKADRKEGGIRTYLEEVGEEES